MRQSKLVGIFILAEKITQVFELVNQKHVKTKNIILTMSTGEWKYVMIYYDRKDVDMSLLLEIKKKLRLNVDIVGANSESEMSDLLYDIP